MATLQVRKAEIGALLIHKGLLDNMDGSRRVGVYDNVMQKCLQIGGSYKPGSRAWVGLGIEDTLDHYIVLPQNKECHFEVKNPLYTPYGAFADLIDDCDDIPDDAVWPRHKQTCVFTHETMMEDLIVAQRYKQAFNGDIPTEWLPSNTAYL